jgi:hypothetical protein
MLYATSLDRLADDISYGIYAASYRGTRRSGYVYHWAPNKVIHSNTTSSDPSSHLDML